MSQSSIVFGFLGESLSLQHSEDFFLCLLVGHSCLHESKDQFIHELIQFGQLPCDFVLVHSRQTGKFRYDLAIVLSY